MKTTLIFFFSIFTLLASAQYSDKDVILKIDDNEITRAEFEAIYKKNNRDSVITKEDLDEYVDLFINFKLKVMEAETMGMDTVGRFQKELAGYREQLSRPYLVDKQVTDSLVREAYNRLQQEVRASHILVKLPADPSPQDTLEAFKKIMKIKAEVEANPAEFGEVAMKKSEDPSAQNNMGDLGYFTSLQMVYPFETAVYNSEKGAITGPVRTRFGYHLVKVEDKRKARGQIKVAHIMIRSEESDPEEVQASLKQRADEVYQKLQTGEDFADLAKRFSDDRSSAAKGGELPPFGTGKMVEEFEKASFALTNPGDISEPVRSPYGWHIIKLIERIPVQSYEEMEKDLKTRIARDSRSDITKESFIIKRKLEYGFTENPKNLKPFYKEIDTLYFKNSWQAPEKLKSSDKVIFSLDGKNYTQADFTAYLVEKMRPQRKTIDLNVLIDQSYKNWVDATVMDYEDSKLEEKYPEFKALMKEYRDGILLFDLTDDKVWSKAVEDSVGLKEFYESHKTDFMWGERAGYDLYTLEDAETAKQVIKMLKKGKNQDDIRDALNEKSALKVRVETGLKEKSEMPVLNNVKWQVGVSEMIENDGQVQVVHIKEIREPQPKGFDEARGIITAAYQNYLENQWIEALRSGREIVVNKEVLYSIK